MKVLIGSRGSRLALWQAEWVKGGLESLGVEAEIKVVKTTGDKLAGTLPMGPDSKGLFIKEIEEALVAETVDAAVHSLKDLPVDQPPGLWIAAVPPREDARDVLISREAQTLSALPAGARIATSSVRRTSQLRALRTDIRLIPIRGNVDTRLAKLDRGDCDALVMAAAGIHRLGFQDRITEYFPPERLCSAVGQGALAIEVRRGDVPVEEAVRSLDDAPTRLAVTAERSALRHLGGGCQTPIAAYAWIEGNQLEMLGVVTSPDGTRVVRARASGASESAEAVGARLADKLLEEGARAILSMRFVKPD
ncbi:MAG TPA: hydroxymethylbilane synthase [Terriglobia bacterium]|nr:hydroxymethylbilane synthase [Terriglobia bacterium]